MSNHAEGIAIVLGPEDGELLLATATISRIRHQ